MPNKYEYAEGMSAEDKRKYRRQARAAAAKGEALPTPVAGLATNGTEGAPKPARGRKATKAAAGGVVVEAPEPVEEEEEEEASAEADEPELLRLFATRGVRHNPRLMVGHGFQVKGFGKQSEPIKEAKIDVMYNKFFARWGHEPTQIRILPGRVVILGPAEYSG